MRLLPPSAAARAARLGLVATALVAAGCAGPPRPDGSGPGTPDLAADAPVVDTTTGSWRGGTDGDVVRYRGLRYALPPTGERRFAPPEAAPDTAEVRDAVRPAPPCPQPGALGAGASEDCLFLDVTAPAEPSPTPRPVLVWWHGGGFTTGAESAFDPRRLVEQGDVVVVTVGYRLGMLGYLAVPGLTGAGTNGLADQLAGLAWARANAAAFGGDPDDVTLAGQSAGAMSACAALTSPAARGLVDRAVLASGSCDLTWPRNTIVPGAEETTTTVPLARAEAASAGAVEAVGCAGRDAAVVLACLRDAPVEALVEQAGAYTFPLAWGTDLLPQDPARAVRAGRVLDVPVLVGGTRDEHRAFVAAALLGEPGLLDEAAYPSAVGASFGDDAPAVLAAYPVSAYLEEADGDADRAAALAWAAVVTDAGWACGTTRSARELAAAGLPVWTWELADRTAPDTSGVAAAGLPLGAAHSGDVPYLFDLGGTDALTGPGQADLGATMVALWTSFARTGVPAAPDAGVDGATTSWPRTTADDAPVLSLGNPDVGLVDHAAEHRCADWAALGY